MTTTMLVEQRVRDIELKKYIWNIVVTPICKYIFLKMCWILEDQLWKKNLLATQLNQTHNNNNNNIIKRNTLKPRNIYECIIVFLPHLSIEMSNNYVFLNERNLVQTSFVLFHFFAKHLIIWNSPVECI